jgi:hypothetical protein
MRPKHGPYLFVLGTIPCLLLFAIVIMAAPSQAVTLNFDFSQGMGTEFYFYNPTSQFALDETGEELRMTKAADGTDESLKLAKVVSQFLIGGNFDVSIDYKLNLPLNDGGQLGFQLYGHNFIFFSVRSNESWLGGDQYHTFLGPRNIQPIPAFPTTDRGGTLRFVRESNIISAYFKSPDSEEYTLIYSEIFDNIYVRFAMVLQNQPSSTSPLNASFRNLRVEADSVLFHPVGSKFQVN